MNYIGISADGVQTDLDGLDLKEVPEDPVRHWKFTATQSEIVLNSDSNKMIC